MLLCKHKVNVKVLMKLLVIGVIIIAQIPSAALAHCYKTLPLCAGSCWIGNCIPKVTSLRPLSSVQDPNGSKSLGTKCGKCVKWLIIIGNCGPSLQGEKC